jgi:hypothetical protein
MAERYWIGEVSEVDDFGDEIEREFIDGKTVNGSWAIMTPKSWHAHGCGKLGTGYGQRYQAVWVKVEG